MCNPFWRVVRRRQSTAASPCPGATAACRLMRFRWAFVSTSAGGPPCSPRFFRPTIRPAHANAFVSVSRPFLLPAADGAGSSQVWLKLASMTSPGSARTGGLTRLCSNGSCTAAPDGMRSRCARTGWAALSYGGHSCSKAVWSARRLSVFIAEKVALGTLGSRVPSSVLRAHVRVLTLLSPHSHMWGQSTQTVSGLSPKRDWDPKRVNGA